MSHAIVVDDLGFAWPDGEVLFDQLSFVVGAGRTGLIGANGSGKSTLLRLVAGELTPPRGSTQVAGSLGAGLPVEEVLGIARARRGLRATEPGETAEEHFAVVGDDWDVDERARATLDRLGLGHVGLERRVGEVSGGERCCSAWPRSSCGDRTCCCWTSRPTNLDMASARQLSQALAAYRGALLVASHDVPFLRGAGITRWLRLDGRLTEVEPP
jgi:ATPase subunit of ABC transporter with duplicated ATPase domains